MITGGTGSFGNAVLMGRYDGEYGRIKLAGENLFFDYSVCAAKPLPLPEGWGYFRLSKSSSGKAKHEICDRR